MGQDWVKGFLRRRRRPRLVNVRASRLERPRFFPSLMWRSERLASPRCHWRCYIRQVTGPTVILMPCGHHSHAMIPRRYLCAQDREDLDDATAASIRPPWSPRGEYWRCSAGTAGLRHGRHMWGIPKSTSSQPAHGALAHSGCREGSGKSKGRTSHMVRVMCLLCPLPEVYQWEVQQNLPLLALPLAASCQPVTSYKRAPKANERYWAGEMRHQNCWQTSTGKLSPGPSPMSQHTCHPPHTQNNKYT